MSGSTAVLAGQHGSADPPHWTSEVQEEIRRAAPYEQHCADILKESWLGDAACPTPSDFASIYRLQVGLNEGVDPPEKHLGEAESIFFAEKLGAQFATDDNGAHDFARRRPGLGPGRVIDSIDILRQCVADYEITAHQARDVAVKIENCGRSFRRSHQGSIDEVSYFDL